MGRAPCCDKASVKKGPWSPEEDAKLKAYIEANGTGGNWIALPQKIGLKRCGKSCRLRWLNYLRPNIKHGGFSEEEDNIICSLYISIGSRWSIIAAQLPGRTDNDIKNYWNTRLKKKLLGKQRKEQQARRAAAAAAAATCLAFKQGMKTENDYIPENYMVSGMVSQAPYWQQFPATAYMPSPMNLRYPLDVSLAHQDHQQLYHQNSMNMISSSFSNISNNFNVSDAGAVVSATPNTNMFQGLEGLSSELSELIYSLDAGVYETGTDSIVDGSSTGTSSVESSSWEDMNSLGYTQILSGFEACHQNMPQVSTLDESNYLGPQ